MLKRTARHYVQIGQQISECRAIYREHKTHDGELPKLSSNAIQTRLRKMLALCSDLEMKVAGALVAKAIQRVPKHLQEFDLLLEGYNEELSSKQLLYLHADNAHLYGAEGFLTRTARLNFPSAYNELKKSGDCLALGQPTASVLHTMRAAEIGLWSLAHEMGVSFPNNPLEMEQWLTLLKQLESRIKAKQEEKKSEKKDADLKFYSEIAADFYYFKDGWRVRAAHARESFSDKQAKKIFERTKDFFNVLATRLKQHST